MPRWASLTGIGGAALFVLGSLLESDSLRNTNLWQELHLADVAMLVCAALAAGLLAIDSVRPSASLAVPAAALAAIAAGQFMWVPLESAWDDAAIGLFVQTAGAVAMVAAAAWRLLLAPARATKPEPIGRAVAIASTVLILATSLTADYVKPPPQVELIDELTLWNLFTRTDVALAVCLAVAAILIAVDLRRVLWAASAGSLVVAGLVLGAVLLFPLEATSDEIDLGMGAYVMLVGGVVLLGTTAVRLFESRLDAPDEAHA